MKVILTLTDTGPGKFNLDVQFSEGVDADTPQTPALEAAQLAIEAITKPAESIRPVSVNGAPVQNENN